jgi:hypothetical protein
MTNQHKKLRQEDPLSIFLFILIIDTLFEILKTAQQKGYIKGLILMD